MKIQKKQIGFILLAVVAVLIVVLIFSLISREDVVEKKVMEKEVIFLNRVVESGVFTTNSNRGVAHKLDFDEELDSEVLYAYQVYGIDIDNKDDVLRLLREEGFLFVQDYPSEQVVVAGKLDDIKRVFGEGEFYEGYDIGAEALIRPDMVDVLKASCEGKVYMETMFSTHWFDDNFERLIPYLGTDKNRVGVMVTVSNYSGLESVIVKEQKEVVFLCDEPDSEFDISDLDAESEDTLYAFGIRRECIRKEDGSYRADYPVQEKDETDEKYELRVWKYVRGKIEKVLLYEGFYLLEDVQSDCIIFVGTIEDVQSVFDRTSSIGDWYVDVKTVAYANGFIGNTEDKPIAKKVSLIRYKEQE